MLKELHRYMSNGFIRNVHCPLPDELKQGQRQGQAQLQIGIKGDGKV